MVLIGIASCAFRSDSQRRVPRFEDFYECYIITDVEISDYGAGEYEQIDCDEFMDLVARARYYRKGAFFPDKELNLYDDEGVRYKLYLSRSRTLFRVDSDCFRLTRSQRRQLQQLLGE